MKVMIMHSSITFFRSFYVKLVVIGIHTENVKKSVDAVFIALYSCTKKLLKVFQNIITSSSHHT